MGAINLNNSGEFIKEIKIFNNGEAGVVENVRMKIEKKNPGEEKKPDYRLIASDGISEVNEGYFYQKPDSDGFKKYQAQRLIQLARGILGQDVQFPVFNTPTEALDGIMKMIAPVLDRNMYRVAVTYGTKKKPSQYLGFKTFGSFIEPMNVPSSLTLSNSDCIVRAPAPAATAASTLISGMQENKDATPNDKLDWMSK
jgi:hypothetical protein